MAILDVIKYEGDNTTFVWKHPIEDFNTGSTLIVHENQEAIFFNNGQALDLFGAGRHVLETQNIPLIRSFLNLPTGGVTPFHCEVYFVNKVEQLAIKWGTDSKVQYMEPMYNFPISIGASGEMGFKITDTRKLLIKLVGTEKILTQQGIAKMFRAAMMTKLKSYLAQTIQAQSISIFEIDSHLEEMSSVMKDKLSNIFDDYGVGLQQFFITNIIRPEGEAVYENFKKLYYRQFSEVAEAKLRQQVNIIDARTKKEQRILDAEAQATKRHLEGYSYQEERSFDVAQRMAENEATGEFTNASLGLGMMAGLGSSIGQTVGQTANDALTHIRPEKKIESVSPDSTSGLMKFCGNCGTPFPDDTTKFCGNCGAKRGGA